MLNRCIVRSLKIGQSPRAGYIAGPKLILSLPLTHPSGFPSMSAVPTPCIVEDLEAALSQLKFARCPYSLTASLAVPQLGDRSSRSLH